MDAQRAATEPPLDSEELALRQLLARIAAGEQQALGQFYDQTLAKVYGLILRVLRNPADAEEVVSDLFLQVWEKARDYQPDRGGALAWLRTLAWSRAVDRQRRQRRHALEMELHPEDGEDTYADCEQLQPETAAAAWSSARAVQAAFGNLSEVQKQILTLAFQQDMSHQDIASHTGMPLGTVKSHARRGLSALRAALGAEGSEHV
jgi:RNA polymerase sigma-70 factor (ECF subfamily)